MLMLPPSVKVFMASAPLDMRKSFDTLARLVQEQLQQDVFSGYLFVFRNKRGDRVKILYWDRNGFCLWAKRLEEGTFPFPVVGKAVCSVSLDELTLLLQGVELTRARLRSIHYESVC